MYISKDLDGLLTLINANTDIINTNMRTVNKAFTKLIRKNRVNKMIALMGFGIGVYQAIRINKLEARITKLNNDVRNLKYGEEDFLK